MIDNSVQDHDSETTKRLFTFALSLAVFTIAYNIAEGLVSTYIGFEDESLTLFGFGVDSFIEAISGLGIAHMVIRTQRRSKDNRDNFEKTALQITGYSFYILAIGLVLSSIYNVVTHHKPIATLWGIVISVISIGTMWALIAGKTRVGKALGSPAILADAECTRICIYMSIILLAASGIYELTNFAYVDSIGTIGLAYLSLREGRECFQKVKNNAPCSC